MSAGSLSPAVQALVDGARREGTLTLVWSANTLGGAEGAQRMVDALNRRYGLQLKVVFTPGPSMDDLAVRLGRNWPPAAPPRATCTWGARVPSKSFLRAGAGADRLAEPGAGRGGRHGRPGDVAVEYMLDVPGGTYNTNLVPPERVPQTTADLLRPEWDGKIASTPYATMFDLLGSPALWGSERTLAYARELSRTLAGVMRCGETPRIVSGEFLMLAFDCGRLRSDAGAIRERPWIR